MPIFPESSCYLLPIGTAIVVPANESKTTVLRDDERKRFADRLTESVCRAVSRAHANRHLARLVLQAEPLEVLADDLVTFARGFLQLPSFQHADSSIPGDNQPSALEAPHHQRDRRTVHAEHDGEEFLLQQKLPGPDAILGLEQPSATALLDIVQRITRRALHNLQQVGLRVERDHLTKRARRRFLDKAAHAHRGERTIRHLQERSTGTRSIAEEHANPEHALTANGSYFHERTIAHLIGDREDAAVGKVHISDRRAVFLKRAADQRQCSSAGAS